MKQYERNIECLSTLSNSLTPPFWIVEDPCTLAHLLFHLRASTAQGETALCMTQWPPPLCQQGLTTDVHEFQDIYNLTFWAKSIISSLFLQFYLYAHCSFQLFKEATYEHPPCPKDFDHVAKTHRHTQPSLTTLLSLSTCLVTTQVPSSELPWQITPTALILQLKDPASLILPKVMMMHRSLLTH